MIIVMREQGRTGDCLSSRAKERSDSRAKDPLNDWVAAEVMFEGVCRADGMESGCRGQVVAKNEVVNVQRVARSSGGRLRPMSGGDQCCSASCLGGVTHRLRRPDLRNE